MPHRAICLTFDYELFFGERSGSVENCILRPTAMLLDLFGELGISATFFVDALFYLRLSRNQTDSRTAGAIKEQLQRIAASGSRIELHLHPHWIDAERNGDAWSFPSYRHYSLASLPDETIMEMFESGADSLNRIAREVVEGYSCVAFRAGGFSLPPFVRIADAFRRTGISVDSSAASGLRIKHPDYEVAYPVVRSSCYRFNSDPLHEEQGGEFVEIPITTRRVSLFEKVARRFAPLPTEPASYGNGVGMVFENSLSRRILPASRLLSLDRGAQEGLISAALAERELCTIISHPKSINAASFELIRRLNDTECSFLTIAEAAAHAR